MEKEVIIDNDIKLKATSPESAAEEYALLIDSRDTILPWLKWLHSYDGLSPKEGVQARTEYQAEKLKQFEKEEPAPEIVENEYLDQQDKVFTM